MAVLKGKLVKKKKKEINSHSAIHSKPSSCLHATLILSLDTEIKQIQLDYDNNTLFNNDNLMKTYLNFPSFEIYCQLSDEKEHKNPNMYLISMSIFHCLCQMLV